MNEATIKQLQTELFDAEGQIGNLEHSVENLEADLEDAQALLNQMIGNRTTLRRLLKQNDALPE